MKTKNRIRINGAVAAIETRQDAENELCDIADLTLERNSAQILLDEEITRARDKYSETLASFNQQIESKSERLREWAELNPDEFPKGKKSLELTHGTLGFRTGTPKLKTISRKTWAAVLETIKRIGLNVWIRSEESVNKEKIIAEARGASADQVPQEWVAEKMRIIGVQVVQDETFFIEPKLEELTSRISEAA